MTSIDSTAGFGATVQPMNTQISPIEARYVESVGVKHLAMLVDETANGAFTKGMAKRLRAALRRQRRLRHLDLGQGGPEPRLLRQARGQGPLDEARPRSM